MSSPSQSLGMRNDLARAERLKSELMKFVTAGPLKKVYEQQHNLYLELADLNDEHEKESLLDWFLFEWFDEQGEGVIDHFLASKEGLGEGDQDLLLDWEDSINSVFEISSLGKNSLRLREIDSGDSFAVVTSGPLNETPLRRGQYIAARLLPLGDRFIFSGVQFIMPDRESAMEALQMRRTLEEIDSPEALEKAQLEQCNAFCELFDCEELTVPSSQLGSVLQRFQHYVFSERRDPETGKTWAEMFHERFGRELKISDMPPPPEGLAGAGEVTILCDEFDGIVLLPEYNRFKRVFETNKPDQDAPGWQELVWRYVKDPDIPIVAFERVAEKHPQRVQKVMRTLLDDDSFSNEHLYAVLLHYKEPVEGLDELEDDRQLWDLFNGNIESKPAPAAARRKTTTKTRLTSAKKGPARKAASRSAAKPKNVSARGKAPARKSPTRKSPARKSAPAKMAKKASAKKR